VKRVEPTDVVEVPEPMVGEQAQETMYPIFDYFTR
jgi:hypothetical protein